MVLSFPPSLSPQPRYRDADFLQDRSLERHLSLKQRSRKANWGIQPLPKQTQPFQLSYVLTM